MPLIPPITDRTLSDVNYAASHTDSLFPNKGALNLDIDLNRIEMNCSYLAVELKKHGYIARIRTKTDWKKSDFLTLTQINRVRKNVNILIKGFYKLYGSPDISTTEMLTWREINSLEQNIKNLDTLLQWMIIGFRYSGTFYSGQEVILP